MFLSAGYKAGLELLGCYDSTVHMAASIQRGVSLKGFRILLKICDRIELILTRSTWQFL